MDEKWVEVMQYVFYIGLFLVAAALGCKAMLMAPPDPKDMDVEDALDQANAEVDWRKFQRKE